MIGILELLMYALTVSDEVLTLLSKNQLKKEYKRKK